MIDRNRLLQLLRADPAPLFAVVDAAHSPAVLPALQTSNLQYECLFSGVPAVTLAQCAPYLVQFAPEEDPLESLIRALWGCNSLFFLNARLDMPAVRVELKKWLQVALPDGTRGLFRFYDPRVWRRTMLHATHAQRAKAFAGGIHRYVTELDEGTSAFMLSARKSAGFSAWLLKEPAIDSARHDLRRTAPATRGLDAKEIHA